MIPKYGARLDTGSRSACVRIQTGFKFKFKHQILTHQMERRAERYYQRHRNNVALRQIIILRKDKTNVQNTVINLMCLTEHHFC